jgi:hypothetical protein
MSKTNNHERSNEIRSITLEGQRQLRLLNFSMIRRTKLPLVTDNCKCQMAKSQKTIESVILYITL